jgi:putative transport protein
LNNILVENPLLLLFIVASLGYLIGTIKIKGSSLGVAAVLFVGLGFGALNKDFAIPDVVFSLGLVLFVYSIGISSGQAFFKSYKKNGLRDFIFILFMLIISGVITVALSYLLGIDAAKITGIYAGSTTNTPALAGVLDYMQGNGLGDSLDSKNVVVGYSYSYPMGVLGSIIAIILVQQIIKIDFDKEKELLAKDYPIGEDLTSKTIEILNDEAIGIELRDLLKSQKWNVKFGRMNASSGQMQLTNYSKMFEKGDQVLAVGSKIELLRVAKFMGRISDKKLSWYREDYDSRRIFLSNPRLVGRSLASLNLDEKYGTIITRIRRGDNDMIAKGSTVLQLGDRIRFVARRQDLKALAKYFGDSYQQVSQVNLFSFGLGIGIGLLLGLIEINLGDAFSFKLGYAGGPLIVGLLLGALGRTGPLVWTLPYSANVTLQQIGLIFLLTAVGVKSGNSFVESFAADGFTMIAASAIISILGALITIIVGYKIVKIPFTLLMGIVSNQPAILDFANSQSKNTVPTFGYTMVFPIALIMKIVIAQVIYLVLC